MGVQVTDLERYCRELTRRSRTNFYYAFLFLPRVKREALFAVYAVCRKIDDVADEPAPGGGSAEALREWRLEIERAYAGQPTQPLTAKLAEVVRRFPIPRAYFDELIAGVEMDLKQSRYATFDELYRYCYRVASVVGLICIEIFGYRNPRTREYAVNLGVALQLTNILRDLRADALRDRVYLPQEELERFGYPEEALLRGETSEAFHRLLAFQCARAREYFSRAATQLPREDRRTLFAGEIMGAIYYHLLRRIERGGDLVLRTAVAVPRAEKLLIALRLWLWSRLFW